MRLGQPILSSSHFDRGKRQRFDFSPFTSDQRDHGSIRTQVLHGWPLWSRGSLTLQSRQVDRLFGNVGGAGSLGIPPHRRFIQLDVPEEGQFCRRLLERHARAQPHYALRQRGAQLARQQAQFFIQGEKDRLRTWRTPRSYGPSPEPCVGALDESGGVGARAAPVALRTSGIAVARRWAELRDRRPCWPEPLLPALAPAASAWPRGPPFRSPSTWPSDALAATPQAPARLLGSRHATPAGSARRSPGSFVPPAALSAGRSVTLPDYAKLRRAPTSDCHLDMYIKKMYYRYRAARGRRCLSTTVL